MINFISQSVHTPRQIITRSAWENLGCVRSPQLIQASRLEWLPTWVPTWQFVFGQTGPTKHYGLFFVLTLDLYCKDLNDYCLLTCCYQFLFSESTVKDERKREPLPASLNQDGCRSIYGKALLIWELVITWQESHGRLGIAYSWLCIDLIAFKNNTYCISFTREFYQ